MTWILIVVFHGHLTTNTVKVNAASERHCYYMAGQIKKQAKEQFDYPVEAYCVRERK